MAEPPAYHGLPLARPLPAPAVRAARPTTAGTPQGRRVRVPRFEGLIAGRAIARAPEVPAFVLGSPPGAQTGTVAAAEPGPPPSPGDGAEALHLGGAAGASERPLDERRRNLLYAYLRRVREAVEAFWTPAPILQAALERMGTPPREDHVELWVHLLLDREGRVRSARLARSSGVPELDRHALDVVARAGPFLPPPAALLDDDGVLGFTYGARTFLVAGAGGP